MRITPVSWVVVLAGAIAFGGGIAGLARILPTDAPRHVASGASTSIPQALAPTQPPEATSTPLPVLAPPPAAALDPIDALDFHPVDASLRDRFGNAPKRAATTGELVALASRYDIVVDDLRWQPDGAEITAAQIAAMKAANPRLRVLRYVGALTNNDGPILNMAPDDGQHGDLFLRDGSGDFVRAYQEIAPWDSKPSYVFDPASTDARNAISAWARQYAKMGYDGILLDGVTPCVPVTGAACAPAVLLSSPLDKTTNRLYTDGAWLTATIGLLAAIRHNAPNAAIFVTAAGDIAPLTPYINGALTLHAQ